MDAFLVANRIPNMLRRFFAEGAFSQGFVPVMARYREKHSHEDAREFVDAVAGTFGLILFLVTCSAWLRRRFWSRSCARVSSARTAVSISQR